MAKIPFPTDVIISNVQITHNTPNFHTESLSMKSKAKSRGIHRIEGSFDITIDGLKAQKQWTAFLLKLQGRLNSFELDLPLHFKTELYQNPTLATAASIGNNQLNLSGIIETIDAGSCFKLLNDDKTYYVLNDVETDGLVSVYPALRQAQLIGTELDFKTPKLLVRLDDDAPIITYEESGKIITQTVRFVEAL